MKTALVFCLLASVFYASELVVTDKRLGRVSPVVLTCLLGLGIFLVTLPVVLWRVRSETVTFPSSWEWGALCLIVVFSALADWFHFGSLNQRAGASVLATFYMLIPVLCSCFKGETPTWRVALAWVLGGAALLLLTYGNGDTLDG